MVGGSLDQLVSPSIFQSYVCQIGQLVSWSLAPSVSQYSWSVDPSVSTSVGWWIVFSQLSVPQLVPGPSVALFVPVISVAGPSVGYSAFDWSVLELVRPSICIVVGSTFMFLSHLIIGPSVSPVDLSLGCLVLQLNSPLFGSSVPWVFL